MAVSLKTIKATAKQLGSSAARAHLTLTLLTLVALTGCSGSPVTGDGGTAGGSTGGGSAGSGGGSAGGSSAGGGSAGGGSAGGGSTGGGAGGGTGGCALPDGGSTCGNGRWCDAPGCTGGTCQPLPPNLVRSPVCGCNGVSFWNVGQSGGSGTAIGSTSSECTTTARRCGGLTGATCPSGIACNYHLPQPLCLASDYDGTCWGMPPVCLVMTTGLISRACAGDACTDECTLIKAGTAWYSSNTCP